MILKPWGVTVWGQKAIMVEDEIANLDKQEATKAWIEEQRKKRAILKHILDEILQLEEQD